MHIKLGFGPTFRVTLCLNTSWTVWETSVVASRFPHFCANINPRFGQNDVDDVTSHFSLDCSKTWSNKPLQNSSSDLSNGTLFRDSHPPSSCCKCLHRRNKSPSDLEADDENDHDSLNQAEGAPACYSRYSSGMGEQFPAATKLFLLAGWSLTCAAP